MILRRKAVAPTHEWDAVVEDSVPELDEAVEVTTPAVGAEEDVEDSAPELDEADAIGGLVVLDTPPIFWLSAKFFKLPMTTDPTPYAVHFFPSSTMKPMKEQRSRSMNIYSILKHRRLIQGL